MVSMRHDVIVIGAGPAGLATALDSAYLGLKVLVLESHKAGGALVSSYPWKEVYSFLGMPGMKGAEVAGKLAEHVRSSGVEILENEHVNAIEGKGPFTVKTGKASHEASAVIIATGIGGVPRKLGVPGEDMEGVLYNLADPGRYKDKRILVVGGGDAAADSALGLGSAGAKVFLAHRRDRLRAMDSVMDKLNSSGVEILWNHEIREILGKRDDEKGPVGRIRLFDNRSGKETELDCDNVLFCLGSEKAAGILKKTGLETEGPLVKVDGDGMTSVPGIFAAGDIVCSLKRIPQALASGEKAAFSAYKRLKDPYWK